MDEVICGQCREPWGFYYITHELGEDEKEDILRGNGCLCCDWGEGDRATGAYQNERVRSIARSTDLDPVRYI
jgi:hypothetical protein